MPILIFIVDISLGQQVDIILIVCFYYVEIILNWQHAYLFVLDTVLYQRCNECVITKNTMCPKEQTYIIYYIAESNVPDAKLTGLYVILSWIDRI